MKQFKSLALMVFVVTTAIFILILGNGFVAHHYRLSDYDGGTYAFYVVTIAISEALTFLIFKFFHKVITFLNDFYVAVLANLFSMALIITILSKFQK